MTDNTRYINSGAEDIKLAGQIEPGFEVLDDPRAYANAALSRVVFDSFDYVEPLDATRDMWVSMPLRLVHDCGGGWRIECGPYTFDAADVHRLREAFAAWDLAVGT